MSRPPIQNMEQWMREQDRRARENERRAGATGPLVAYWRRLADSTSIANDLAWRGVSGWANDAGLSGIPGDSPYMAPVAGPGVDGFMGFQAQFPGIYRLTVNFCLTGATASAVNWQQVRISVIRPPAMTPVQLVQGERLLGAANNTQSPSNLSGVARLEAGDSLVGQIRHIHSGTVQMAVDSAYWGEYLRP